jgi:SlyX protein
MTETENLLARIDALEMRVAYQDQTIEDLNAAVTEQWKLIDALNRKVARFDEQLQDAQSATGQGLIPEPPPPHY